MKIELKEINVRDLANGYQDNAEAGVVGYSGKLDIRPPYQREFIYKDKQRDAVINTVTRSFPLNVMYWSVRDGGDYEVIDGQQRTISLCQYAEGDFYYQGRFFQNLQSDEQEQILDYKLMVYLCSGTDSERLDWFRTINIAGEKLTDQELRNAVYAGSWVTDAKRYFSKTGCPAFAIGSNYIMGSPIRQEYLETAIKWIAARDCLAAIEDYMARHQNDDNANQIWLYFQKVIQWVEAIFPKKRSEMKGVAWGLLYNVHKDRELDHDELEARVSALMMDDEVTAKKGVFQYVLGGDERHLNLRAFSPAQKRQIFERDGGKCQGRNCSVEGGVAIEDLSHGEFDHITPWSQGGKTEVENGQLLCRDCNRRKSDT